MARLVAKTKAVEKEPRSRAGRIALAQMVMKLFDLWKLSAQDQMRLLGLSESSRMSLSRYRKGEPLADSRDLLDRAANLLAIHRSLRILFPHNKDIIYNWMTAGNKAFEGRSPIQVIRDEGFTGLLAVRRHLDHARGGDYV